jgi:3-oxoacyl-[acyl-carrier-protein] synthase II
MASPPPPHRVVVTGLGAITPLGLSVSAFWDGLMAGRSGAAPISHFDASDLTTRFACEVNGFDPLDYMDRKQANRLDLFVQFALAAAQEAFADADLDTATLTDDQRDRVGVIFGSGFGGLEWLENQTKAFHERGPMRLSPFFIPMMIANMAPAQIAMAHGLRGPNQSVVTACATGNDNIADAVLRLRHGHADAVLCGGTEASVTPIGIGGFAVMKALSTRNDEPETASRPFDRTRDGFVAGEGAAALLLETLEHAEARGARIYAEAIGFGASNDAYHFAAPDPDGRGAELALRAVLRDAGLAPKDVDYINLHATSTPLGDVVEVDAVKRVFGDHAYAMSLSSTKSATGHLLGAAGAAEAIATILAIAHDRIPPTINTQDLDDGFDLDFTLGKPRERRVDVALSNAFGFGGHNTSVAFRRFEGA